MPEQEVICHWQKTSMYVLVTRQLDRRKQFELFHTLHHPNLKSIVRVYWTGVVEATRTIVLQHHETAVRIVASHLDPVETCK